MKYILQLLVLALYIGKLHAHPSHFTIVNMDILRTEMRIDYSFHINSDDYNYLLYGVFHDELAASRSDSTINMNNIIVKNYIEKNFLVLADNTLLLPEFKGMKKDDDDIWFFFQIRLNQIPDSINIINKLFLGLYTDQINLLILDDGLNQNGFTFDNNNTEQRFALKNI